MHRLKPLIKDLFHWPFKPWVRGFWFGVSVVLLLYLSVYQLHNDRKSYEIVWMLSSLIAVPGYALAFFLSYLALPSWQGDIWQVASILALPLTGVFYAITFRTISLKPFPTFQVFLIAIYFFASALLLFFMVNPAPRYM